MKKRIAIIIPTLSGGGAERVAANLSLYLPNDKYDKYLIVYDGSKTDYSFEGKLLNLESRAISNPISKIFNNIKRIIKIKKIKKDYKIDTTISFLSAPNMVNILTKSNDKVIVSIRNYVSDSSKNTYEKIGLRLIPLLYNKADSIVCVSNLIKDDMLKNYKIPNSKLVTIYNSYDYEKIISLAKDSDIEESSDVFEHPTIITVGSLTFQKGQWHLIRAFSKILCEIPNAKLIILGKGELQNYLSDLVKNLNIEESVRFLGYQSNPFKYIYRSSLYVFPSLFEGFPNALCEAMVCGKPIISSDCKSGPREILAPDTNINTQISEIEYCEYGILTPVCDGQMYSHEEKLTKEELLLYKSMLNLLRNPDLMKAYGLKSNERVQSFSVDRIIREWENIL